MQPKEMIKKLQRNFSNRLIIIDEVHNIRIGDEKQDKRVAQELLKLVKYADNSYIISVTVGYDCYYSSVLSSISTFCLVFQKLCIVYRGSV